MNRMKEENNKGLEFIKKLTGFSSAAWISAAISFISTPIVTRMFLPEEIGKVNLFITFLTFFQTVCILGLDQAYMRFYNEKMDGLERDKLLSVCLRINLIIAAISSIMIFIFTDFISTTIVGESNWKVSFLLIIAMFASDILRMNSIHSRMQQKIGLYLFQSVSTTIIEKLSYIAAMVVAPTHFNAMLIITIGYLLISSIMLVINKKYIFCSTNGVKKEAVKTVLKFAVPYLPVLLLSWLNNSIPQLFLRQFVDYSSIGIYSNAVTIANILTILQTGFSVYWSPFAYENYEKNPQRLRKVHRIITLLIILLALFVVFGQDIIYILLGEEYRASKLFFAFLLFTPVCNTIADTTGIGIMISKKSYKNIITFICNSTTNVCLCLLLIPIIGVSGAAIAAGTSAIVMLAVRTYLGGKYYKIINSYKHIIISILSLYIVAITNLCMSQFMIVKYGIPLIAIIINIITYRKEIFYLFDFTKSIFKDILKR